MLNQRNINFPKIPLMNDSHILHTDSLCETSFKNNPLHASKEKHVKLMTCTHICQQKLFSTCDCRRLRQTIELVARKWRQKIIAPKAACSRQTVRSNDPNGSLLGRLDQPMKEKSVNLAHTTVQWLKILSTFLVDAVI